MCDVPTWKNKNKCNTRIAQYLKKLKQLDNEIWPVNRITWETFLLKNHSQNMVDKLFPDPFLKIQNLWISSL